MRRLFYLFIALLLVSGGFAQQNVSPFTMDDIKNWTGTGPNRAALAVQWVTGEDPTELVAEDIHFLVWGYRWEDGEKPSALDMIRTVISELSCERTINLYGSFVFRNAGRCRKGSCHLGIWI